jgi:hypothetical protein
MCILKSKSGILCIVYTLPSLYALPDLRSKKKTACLQQPFVHSHTSYSFPLTTCSSYVSGIHRIRSYNGGDQGYMNDRGVHVVAPPAAPCQPAQVRAASSIDSSLFSSIPSKAQRRYGSARCRRGDAGRRRRTSTGTQRTITDPRARLH